MMEENIPLIYQIIIHRLYSVAIGNVLEVNRARRIIGMSFRMPRGSVSKILIEMKKMGIISFENKRRVILEIPKKELRVFT